MYRELGQQISDYLLSLGINPLFVFTPICILFSLSYFKYFKTWEEEPWWRKGFAIGTFFGTAIIIATILVLFGAI